MNSQHYPYYISQRVAKLGVQPESTDNAQWRRTPYRLAIIQQMLTRSAYAQRALQQNYTCAQARN